MEDRDWFETDLTGETEEERELHHIRRCEDRDWEQGIRNYEEDEE